MTGCGLLDALTASRIRATPGVRVSGPRLDSWPLTLLDGERVNSIRLRLPDLGARIRRRCWLHSDDKGLWLDLERPQWQAVRYAAMPGNGSGSVLDFTLGLDSSGKPLVDNLAVLPHLLIAGCTGSGKSVALHTLLLGLLAKGPDVVKLALVDTKRVELAGYAVLPHMLYQPAHTRAEAARLLTLLLQAAEGRYTLMQALGHKDFAAANAAGAGLPRIVLVIDELADLLLGEESDSDTRTLLIRLAQLSRAAGIHIIAATQLPHHRIVDSQIKVNFPARLALAVPSGTEARVIGVSGAEGLLGHGDALYMRPGQPTRRVQVALSGATDFAAMVAHWLVPGAAPAPSIIPPAPPVAPLTPSRYAYVPYRRKPDLVWLWVALGLAAMWVAPFIIWLCGGYN